MDVYMMCKQQLYGCEKKKTCEERRGGKKGNKKNIETRKGDWTKENGAVAWRGGEIRTDRQTFISRCHG